MENTDNLLKIFLFITVITACSQSNEKKEKKEKNIKTNTESIIEIENKEQKMTTPNTTPTSEKKTEETPNQKTPQQSTPQNNITDLPSGEHTITSLRKALKKLAAQYPDNTVVIYDDTAKIEDLTTYTHEAGRIEFTAVIGAGSEASDEKTFSITLLPENTIQTLSLINSPSGTYSIEKLREALEKTAIEGGGQLEIHDENGKIEDLSTYTHADGDVTFIFKASRDNTTPLEETITLTIETEKRIKKALLIGINGIQYEKLVSLNTPNFDRLTIKKAYTGGFNDKNNTQSTSNGPGWATALTGVWANKHGITSGEGLANTDYPSVFKRLHQHNADLIQAAILNWNKPNTSYFKDDFTVVRRIKNNIDDAAAVNTTLDEVENGTDFIFTLLETPFTAAKANGFDNDYNNSIATVDLQLGRILDAIESAEASTDQDWLVLVTTGHGFKATGLSYGTQTGLEKTIFIGSNKTLNEEFTTVATTPITDFGGIYGFPAQTSITPTILRHFGITIDKGWKLDGPSLLGEIGPRKLMTSAQATLTWHSNSSENIDIYKNGQLIDTVPANQKSWVDTAPTQDSVIDYVIALNEHSLALRIKPITIVAAMRWDDDEGAYFLRSDGQYEYYDRDNGSVSNSFPHPIADDNWEGLAPYKFLITAAVWLNDEVSWIFLEDGTYLNYHNENSYVRSGYPAPIRGNWSGLGDYAHLISSAVERDDYVYFFTTDGRYLRYNLDENKIDNGPHEIKGNWSGSGNSGHTITAVTRWNDDVVYFYLDNQQYIPYSWDDSNISDGYPADIKSNWDGLLVD